MTTYEPETRILRTITDSLIRAIINGEANARELAINAAESVDNLFGPEMDADAWVDGVLDEDLEEVEF